MERKMETTICHLGFRVYGDVVSKLMTPITHIASPVIPLINLLTT